ncbi:hypothetical protein TNCV_83221 [Trichonephila clavipes]|nr:hypothetical protein TNCV_83221 [Trichonephila clavipes]
MTFGIKNVMILATHIRNIHFIQKVKVTSLQDTTLEAQHHTKSDKKRTLKLVHVKIFFQPGLQAVIPISKEIYTRYSVFSSRFRDFCGMSSTHRYDLVSPSHVPAEIRGSPRQDKRDEDAFTILATYDVEAQPRRTF